MTSGYKIDQSKALIIPGIWIGDYNAANDTEFIKSENIELVINLSGGTVNKNPGTSYMELKLDDCDYFQWLQQADKNSPKYNELILNIKSIEPKIIQLFENASDVLAGYRKNKKNVLVNCYAGINRSATTLACYFVRYCDIKPDDAIDVLVTTNSKKRNMPALTNQYFRYLLTRVKKVVTQ